jgi:hypothetical protein
LGALEERITEGDQAVAADLADAFGPYGVPLTSLTREEAASIASEYLFVRDWDFDQGAVPRFLGRFVNLFPDETYNLLLRRIERAKHAREDKQEWLRTSHIPEQLRIILGRIG